MAVRDIVMAAAGNTGEATYVEDVFSTYIYTGNSTSGGSQYVRNNLVLSDSNEIIFSNPGSYTWVCPAGVTSVSVVCVGGGGSGDLDGGVTYTAGGGGGGLGYKNNISVTPGTSYTVVVGAGGSLSNGGTSYFMGAGTVSGAGGGAGSYGYGGSGGGYVGDGGGNGGNGGTNPGGGVICGGGGAGGYSGNGGDGGGTDTTRTDGSGGGGAGGNSQPGSVSGGGVGIFGQGTSGVGAGVGGSGGTNGTAFTGGLYGGGGNGESTGRSGAVRIVWPGDVRSFPTTDVAQRTNTAGGLVWIKGRNVASNNVLFDTTRGPGTSATANKVLSSNQTFGSTTTAYDFLSAFYDTGFVVTQGGTATATRGANFSNSTYGSWSFKKAEKFFDIVTWTGNGLSSQTIPHNLGSTPGFIVIKSLGLTQNWWVYHRSTGTGNYLVLNTTAAQVANNTVVSATSSTDFTVGSTVTSSSYTYIAYVFAHDAGGFGDSGSDNVISCGSYTGNGGSQTINLGYEPQWLLVKRASGGTGNWYLMDNIRGLFTSGIKANYVQPNTAAAEVNDPNIYAYATGFGLNSEGSAEYNATGSTYIYVAIRRGPMATPTIGTDVFTPVLGTSTTPGMPAPHTVDSAWVGLRPGSSPEYQNLSSRLTNTYLMASSNTIAEETNLNWNYILQTGFGTNAFYSDYVGWLFRRAPGFFDVVCYSASGTNYSAITRNHNLGVAPELYIVKPRTSNGSYGLWIVGSPLIGNTYNLVLNNSGAIVNNGFFTSTAPTSTTFTVQYELNTSGNHYIAYLFASCPGVSKVGTYTGTGTTQQINCGFTTGARFVLIKRYDIGSTGDWYVWDSARGIVAGNDPYLLMNSTAAEVTSTDYVDTFSSGFEISSTAPAAINANGGTFIFLAIA